MLPTPRCYQDENDLARMLALLETGRAARNGSYYVHSGDLKWWLYYPPLERTLWDNIYLWEDPSGSDDLLGWALLDPEGATWDVYCRPDLYGTDLASSMYTWAADTLTPLAKAAGNKEIGAFWVTPEDSFRTHWLEERGYRITAYDPALARSLVDAVPETPVPAGFQIRSCRGIEEVQARAAAQYGAFQSSAPLDLYVQRFTRFMQSPVYFPDADVVAAAPDGRIAAFCITWIDKTNCVGLFEPVGTHPDFQRMGLGKAVMLESLRRLQAQGMKKAVICTAHNNTGALHLYTSLGFQPYTEFRFYAKTLETA